MAASPTGVTLRCQGGVTAQLGAVGSGARAVPEEAGEERGWSVRSIPAYIPLPKGLLNPLHPDRVICGKFCSWVQHCNVLRVCACSPESVPDVLERTSPGGSSCCKLELPAFSRCRIELLSHSRKGISNLLLPLDLSGWKYFSESQKPPLGPAEGLLQETSLERFQPCHPWLYFLRQHFLFFKVAL